MHPERPRPADQPGNFTEQSRQHIIVAGENYLMLLQKKHQTFEQVYVLLAHLEAPAKAYTKMNEQYAQRDLEV